jgi:hypothetical protein
MASTNAEKKERRAEERVIGTSGADSDLRTTTRATSGTVIVGCKIPNGLILQLSTMERTIEPVMGGGHRDIQIGRKVGPRYVVKGPAFPVGQVPRYLIAGGYALTSGIPEEFWNDWYAQNKDADYVRNELIVAHKSMEDAERHCIDNESLVTGLEPVDPTKPPRGFKAGQIETAEEMGNRAAR